MKQFTDDELIELMVEARREQRDPAVIYSDGADWTQTVFDLAQALLRERDRCCNNCGNPYTADRLGSNTA